MSLLVLNYIIVFANHIHTNPSMCEIFEQVTVLHVGQRKEIIEKAFARHPSCSCRTELRQPLEVVHYYRLNLLMVYDNGRVIEIRYYRPQRKAPRSPSD